MMSIQERKRPCSRPWLRIFSVWSTSTASDLLMVASACADEDLRSSRSSTPTILIDIVLLSTDENVP